MGAVGKEARKALLEYLEVNLKYGENVFFIEKMLSAFSQLTFALYVLIGNDSHLAKENQTIQSKPNKTKHFLVLINSLITETNVLPYPGQSC